jgi:hypothetical protein
LWVPAGWDRKGFGMVWFGQEAAIHWSS